MKKFIFLVIFILFLSGCGKTMIEEVVLISGRVISENNKAIEGVKITILEIEGSSEKQELLNSSTYTDEFGNYDMIIHKDTEWEESLFGKKKYTRYLDMVKYSIEKEGYLEKIILIEIDDYENINIDPIEITLEED